MELPFRVRQATKDFECARFDRFRQVRALNQGLNLPQVSLGGLGGRVNFQACAHQTAAHGAGPLELVKPQRDFFQLRVQKLRREAGIEQRAQKHVAADAG